MTLKYISQSFRLPFFDTLNQLSKNIEFLQESNMYFLIDCQKERVKENKSKGRSKIVGYRWLNEQCSQRGRHNGDHNQAFDV